MNDDVIIRKINLIQVFSIFMTLRLTRHVFTWMLTPEYWSGERHRRSCKRTQRPTASWCPSSRTQQHGTGRSSGSDSTLQVFKRDNQQASLSRRCNPVTHTEDCFADAT